ncbi:MAG: ribokinase [Chloroflexaceae bacterium]|nr:ribokinase [Chloroflexaceae bacterium]
MIQVEHADAAALVAGLAGKHILVVGDISLDEYLYGQATRLSREAPIPVLELMHREVILGAATNPAHNMVSLGSRATQVGIVGDDAEGQQVLEALQRDGIAADGVITAEAHRPTTTKTRILAHAPPRLPQQVARLDRVDHRPLAPVDEQRVCAILADYIPSVDAVLCSDYRLGLLTSEVVDTIRNLCQQHGVLLTVDAQGNSHYYREADLFRCNNVEAAAALGVALRTEAEYRAGLEQLRAKLRARLVIVTRGPDGLSMVSDETGYVRLEAVNVSDVYDTTGAGDTFIAVATLALVSGLDPLVVAHLANTAAALTVRKFGNAVVQPQELAAALRQHHACSV